MGWHAGHRQPTAVPATQIVRKSARVREEQRKCTHLRQAEHWRESLPTSRWQMEQGYLGWGWLLMGPGFGWTLPLIRSNARIRWCRKGVRSIRSRGAAQLWPVSERPSEKTVRDNGGDLSVEPLRRSVLPFQPIPIGEGTAPPRWGGRTLVQKHLVSSHKSVNMNIMEHNFKHILLSPKLVKYKHYRATISNNQYCHQNQSIYMNIIETHFQPTNTLAKTNQLWI